MDRESAWGLVKEFAKSESLLKHCLSVEAVMRAYARKAGEDEEVWGIAGMLHDFDWDVCPTQEEHPQYGAQILRERGYPEMIVRAILSHGNHTGIPRESLMEKALFAVDELSGFRHSGGSGQALQEPFGHRGQVGAKEDEGQGLRPQRQP